MSKVFWLSFCDADRPEGEQFLGACLVEVTEAEAAEAATFIAALFPHAEEGSEWIGAATRKAHALGCNPGGEVACVEIEPDHPHLRHYQMALLMDRAIIERIEAAIVDNNDPSA